MFTGLKLIEVFSNAGSETMIDQPGGVGGNVLVVQMMQSSTGYDGIVLRRPGNARQCLQCKQYCNVSYNCSIGSRN